MKRAKRANAVAVPVHPGQEGPGQKLQGAAGEAHDLFGVEQVRRRRRLQQAQPLDAAQAGRQSGLQRRGALRVWAAGDVAAAGEN